MRVDPSAFAAVIRSVDDGLPIDAARIRDRMEAALGNGALNVALAQGEIAVAAGQLRLANTAIRAKGAELGVSLGLDLSGSAIDARLVLSGAPGSGALEGIRPEIALALRGPFDAPKRTLDVAAFTNWLALRAIEEKDKRIDALQSGREVPVPACARPCSRPSRHPLRHRAATPAPVGRPCRSRSRRHRRHGRRRRRQRRRRPTSGRRLRRRPQTPAEAGATAAAASGVSFLA